MKPVVRVVVDKNGAEETVFTPTARMILYSIHKSRNQHLSDSEVCAKAGLDPQLPNRWAVKYGSLYMDWLGEAMELETGDDALVLERFGMMQALQPGNFQYFREMAKTKGVIKDEAPKASLTLNTDFNVILLATGGDLNAARAQLLQAARGLAIPGGPAMALPALGAERQPGSDQGAGNRAGHLQGGPLEVSDALGSDGGRPEQGEPVPALSRRPAFASSYRVLDEGEIPASAEESSDDGNLDL